MTRASISSGIKQAHILSSIRLVSRSRVRFEYGFGFDSLYHPYVEALRVGALSGGAALLADFYRAQEAYIATFPTLVERWPIQAWGDDVVVRAMISSGGTPTGQFTNFSGGYRNAAVVRAKRLYELRDSVTKEGFWWGRTFLGSNLTGVRIGDTVLVQGGQHRISVLGALGFRTFPIALRGRRELVGKVLSPETLPLVVAGAVELPVATRILNRISGGISVADAVYLGFPFASDY